ncbi:MAG: cell division protein SepF [Micrococcales bacterium]
MSMFSNALSYVGLNGRDKGSRTPASATNAVFKNVTPMRNRGRTDGMYIVTVNLHSYAQAKEVSTAFREGANVIVEMSGAASTDQAKMVNFMCGLKEGLEGNLERVTQTVFLLAHYGTSEGNDFDEHGGQSDSLVISPNF